eukprot:CAMPEP_0117479546 /NCGR_PEP_ID=MMETSP0784-20121206/11940_1 /TAXON_ID=39447 /ORGANISM="" /LENGTH=183 /DNA_ID=CAMNT_0005273975 /DNA_START=27 /DNA_END=574 /DNA_ORIENTATION=+
MTLRGGGKCKVVKMNGASVVTVDLEQELGPKVEEENDESTKGETYSITLECEMEDHHWAPAEEYRRIPDTASAPEEGVVDNAAAWRALFRGPVCIGELQPIVKARCHGFGGADDDPEHFVLQVPAVLHGTAAALCAGLSQRLRTAADELAVYHETCAGPSFGDRGRVAVSTPRDLRAHRVLWP